MARTKVLMAFGEHGNPGSRRIADKSFFRGAVEPFLEAHRDKRIFILQEGLASNMDTDEVRRFYLTCPQDRPLLLDAIQAYLSAWEAGFNFELDRFATHEERPATVDLTALDWGILDLAFPIRTTGLNIRMQLEPQTVEAYAASWEAGIFHRLATNNLEHPDARAYLFHWLRSKAKSVRIRDEMLARLLASLSEAHPEAVFVLLRGSAHRWMTVLLPPDRYDVHSHQHDTANHPIFVSDAVVARNRDPSDPSILFPYVELEWATQRFFFPRALYLHGLSLSPAQLHAKLNLLLPDAVQHALDTHPSIAKELGYTW